METLCEKIKTQLRFKLARDLADQGSGYYSLEEILEDKLDKLADMLVKMLEEK